jgi:DNA-directed RNA polymerase subunit L
MRDPVFTSDGETYEREEIERWLRLNHTSPATNVKLTDKVLKPNIALKKAINTFLEQHDEFFDEVYFSRSSEMSFIGNVRK